MLFPMILWVDNKPHQVSSNPEQEGAELHGLLKDIQMCEREIRKNNRLIQAYNTRYPQLSEQQADESNIVGDTNNQQNITELIEQQNITELIEQLGISEFIGQQNVSALIEQQSISALINILTQKIVQLEENTIEPQHKQLQVFGTQFAEDIDGDKKIIADDVLIWKITDFTEKKNYAATSRYGNKSFYSPSFLTKEGYTLYARLYPNGDGMGRGTHLSLYVGIMKGEKDNQLSWPFNKRITFILTDHSDRPKHHELAMETDSSPASSSYKKPTAEMNIASGFPQVISLTSLNDGGHVYIKNDCLIVKIFVSQGGGASWSM